MICEKWCTQIEWNMRAERKRKRNETKRNQMKRVTTKEESNETTENERRGFHCELSERCRCRLPHYNFTVAL